ncbi:MAG: cytochrome b562 [Verrucomicrobiota bacterium]
MKFKTLLTLAATLALGFNVALAAEDDSPLGTEMKAMNKALRTLKKQLADTTKKEDNLALVGKMKKATEDSKKHDPAKTKDIPAADKVAYLAKYKEQMDGLSKSFDDLETAVKEDKVDDAKKILEKLSEQKEKGHKDFNPDDK